jgi:hypothetical protein
MPIVVLVVMMVVGRRVGGGETLPRNGRWGEIEMR